MKPDSSRSNGISLYKVGFNRREKLLEASVRDRISRWLEGHLAIFYKNVNLMRPARCDPDIARSSSKEEASFRSQVLVSNQGAFNGELRAEMSNVSF